MVGAEVFFIALFIAILTTVFRKQRASSGRPSDVLRYLKQPGARHTVRHRGAFEGSHGLWNPAESWRPTNLLYGSGEGTYWIDAEGQVNLDWQPRNGQPAHYVGPVPKKADPRSPNRLRARRAMRTVFAIYLLSAAAGCALGYAFTSGDSTHRAAIGLFGLGGGYFSAYIVMVTAIGVIRVRRGRRSSRRRAE